MIANLAKPVRDKCERLAQEYLVHLGLERIVYEPDGNIPPDFLVNDRIAVEVRRLNQNEVTESGGIRGLEETRISTQGKLCQLLHSLGPAKLGASWFVGYTLKRPIPRWKQVEPELRRQLENFRDCESHQEPCCIAVADGLKIRIFLKASDPHPTFLVYGGGSDRDAGGFVFVETQRNLRLCIAEKTRKIARVRHKYPEWWLVLVDLIGNGVDVCDRQLYSEHLGIDHEWDKVVLLSSLDPSRAFEIPRKSIGQS